MINTKQASAGRKARLAREFQARLDRQREATQGTSDRPYRDFWYFTWLRDRKYGRGQSVIEVESSECIAEKYAREREWEMMAVIAAEREQATMLGISTGSGT